MEIGETKKGPIMKIEKMVERLKGSKVSIIGIDNCGNKKRIYVKYDNYNFCIYEDIENTYKHIVGTIEVATLTGFYLDDFLKITEKVTLLASGVGLKISYNWTTRKATIYIIETVDNINYLRIFNYSSKSGNDITTYIYDSWKSNSKKIVSLLTDLNGKQRRRKSFDLIKATQIILKTLYPRSKGWAHDFSKTCLIISNENVRLKKLRRIEIKKIGSWEFDLKFDRKRMGIE